MIKMYVKKLVNMTLENPAYIRKCSAALSAQA